ncbi:MAG: peptidoglycan DD-metalloendopeptidase family protein [Lachnospiraceae bacterium]|nr:peptidoglycan DD-metalloendopeptidase family protein [Lachnospiraceae bacterium]
MKPRKHRHKESFSVLLISNTGQNTRHFHVSGFCMRLITVFVLLVCGAFGWLIYEYTSSNEITGNYVNASESTDEEEAFLEQLAEQERLIQQLEEERDALSRRNDDLVSENKALLAAAKTNMGSNGASTVGDIGGTEDDPAYPSRYPYSTTGEVSEKYSESHPYVSIDTQDEGDVVAAGSGTITMIGSDDTYALIIEIEHGNGYRTRYMLPQSAEPLQEKGAQVQAGTTLVLIDTNNVQLDYQVIYEEKPIDPLIVFEAKG